MSTLSISPAFAPTASKRAGSTVRLTRRGRLVVFLASLTFALVAAFVLAGGAVGRCGVGGVWGSGVWVASCRHR